MVVRKEMGWSKRYVFAVTSGTSSEKEVHTVLMLEKQGAVKYVLYFSSLSRDSYSSRAVMR